MTTPLEEIKKAMEAGPTPGPWIGPIVSDGWPPGWIAVCMAYEDEPTEHVPGAYFVSTGHYGDGIARNLGKSHTAAGRDAAFIAACSPSNISALLQHIEALEADKARLIEDRARFPDRPDDIGAMIGTRFGNLKAVAQSNEDAWRRAEARADSLATDAVRYRALRTLDWIDEAIMKRHRIKDGKPETLDAAIDAARRET